MTDTVTLDIETINEVGLGKLLLGREVSVAWLEKERAIQKWRDAMDRRNAYIQQLVVKVGRALDEQPNIRWEVVSHPKSSSLIFIHSSCKTKGTAERKLHKLKRNERSKRTEQNSDDYALVRAERWPSYVAGYSHHYNSTGYTLVTCLLYKRPNLTVTAAEEGCCVALGGHVAVGEHVLAALMQLAPELPEQLVQSYRKQIELRTNPPMGYWGKPRYPAKSLLTAPERLMEFAVRRLGGFSVVRTGKGMTSVTAGGRTVLANDLAEGLAIILTETPLDEVVPEPIHPNYQ